MWLYKYIIILYSAVALKFVIHSDPSDKDSMGLFHKVTSSVMTGDNISENDNNDWSLFHRTSDL